MNKHWPVDTDRFGRIVITDAGGDAVIGQPRYFVNFSLDVNRALVQAISTHPNVMSHIGTSSNIEEITFAADRPLDQADRRARGAQLVDRPSDADRPALGRRDLLTVGGGLGALLPGPVELPRTGGYGAVGPDHHDDARDRARRTTASQTASSARSTSWTRAASCVRSPVGRRPPGRRSSCGWPSVPVDLDHSVAASIVGRVGRHRHHRRRRRRAQ